MRFKIATPISHLFENQMNAINITSHSDILEVRDRSAGHYDCACCLYHSELNILAEWNEKEKEFLKKVKKEDNPIVASFHLASRYQVNDITLNECGKAFKGVGKPMSIYDMKTNVRNNCRTAKEIFGKNIVILVENINHLLTDAYDRITDSSFIKDVVINNNIHFCLDIAHAIITCVNKKLNFSNYIKELPLNRCLQVHISKPLKNENNIARDSHEALSECEWELLDYILDMTKNINYVTLEYYKDSILLVNQLKRLKELQ